MSTQRTVLSFLSLFFVLGSCLIECKRTSDYANILNLNNPKCTDKLLLKNELKMVKLLVFGPKGRTFPSNIDGMKQFCNETIRLTKELEAFFKECTKSEVSNIASVFIYSIRSTFHRSYCGKNVKNSQKFIKNSACFNRHYFSKYDCFATFNEQTRKLVNLKEDKDKIPHTCCNYQKMMNCLTKLLDAQSCTAQLRDESMDIIRRSTAGLTDLVCSDYTEETDKCDRLGPGPSAPNRKVYTSFILALTDLIASMSGFSSTAN